MGKPSLIPFREQCDVVKRTLAPKSDSGLGRILVLPLPSCAALGKGLNLSEFSIF